MIVCYEHMKMWENTADIDGSAVYLEGSRTEASTKGLIVHQASYNPVYMVPCPDSSNF